MNKTMVLLMAVVIMSTAFTACKSKPKDADLKTAAETALTAKPNASGVTVTVDKGVATLSGQVADEMAKEDLGKAVAGIKGISSVVNNLIIAPVAAVPIAADDALTASVKDATKDFPSVNAIVVDGVVTLKGEIKKENLRKLIMALNTLNPKRIDNTQLVIK